MSSNFTIKHNVIKLVDTYQKNKLKLVDAFHRASCMSINL
jgi:hypothetical protein